MKKKRRKTMRAISVTLIVIALLLIVGCGAYYVITNKNSEIDAADNTTEIQSGNATESSDNTGEVSQPEEKAESDAKETTTTSKELFEKFMAGEIDGVGINEDGEKSTLSAASLNINGDDWDSSTFYGYKDVDNDGEDELVLSGPYGFELFDICDGKVTLFEEGLGGGSTCLLANYEGACWVVQAHADAESDFYYFKKYSGSESVVDSFSIGIAPEESQVYTYVSHNGDESIITEEEYTKIIKTLEASN